MRNTATIRKDYVWNTIGVFAQNVISPLLLIFITRENGIIDAGIFSFAFSIAVVFWVIGMWGGRTFQASDASGEFSQHNYIVTRLILSGVMLLGAIVFVFANQYGIDKSALIIVLVFLKAIESVADALYATMQIHNKLYISGMSLLYKAVAGFGIFIVINFVAESILLASTGLVVVNLLLVVLYDIPRTKSLEAGALDRKVKTGYLRDSFSIIRRTTPTFLILFLSVLPLNIPRYFLDNYHEDQMGYFGIIAMPVTLIGLIMSFMLQPSVVNLSILYMKKQYDRFHDVVRRLLLFIVGAGVSIILVTYLLGVPVLDTIFKASFLGVRSSLLIMVAGGVLNAFVSIFINVLIIMRSFRMQLYILLISNIALMVLSYGLLDMFSLKGAVTLYTLANLVQLLTLFFNYVKTLDTAKRA